MCRHPAPTLFPYTTLFRSAEHSAGIREIRKLGAVEAICRRRVVAEAEQRRVGAAWLGTGRIAVHCLLVEDPQMCVAVDGPDRKSTRLNSSHANISYAVFCL